MTHSTDAWKAKGEYFTHRGHKIFWRQEGREGAPVLLLIHGFPTASWDWQHVWPDLLKRYRLLTLDMIGFGYSDKPRDYTYSIIDQADIYDRFLAMLGVAISNVPTGRSLKVSVSSTAGSSLKPTGVCVFSRSCSRRSGRLYRS
jgi:alpha-beta hydrolase superfamily lysophospholipase